MMHDKINPADDDKHEIINEKYVICSSWKMLLFLYSLYDSGYNNCNHS